MSQFNINLTPEFERDLKSYMRKKGIQQKSEALRLALREIVEQLSVDKRGLNYTGWLGLGLKSPPKPISKRKFKDDSITL